MKRTLFSPTTSLHDVSLISEPKEPRSLASALEESIAYVPTSSQQVADVVLQLTSASCATQLSAEDQLSVAAMVSAEVGNFWGLVLEDVRLRRMKSHVDNEQLRQFAIFVVRSAIETFNTCVQKAQDFNGRRVFTAVANITRLKAIAMEATSARLKKMTLKRWLDTVPPSGISSKEERVKSDMIDLEEIAKMELSSKRPNAMMSTTGHLKEVQRELLDLKAAQAKSRPKDISALANYKLSLSSLGEIFGKHQPAYMRDFSLVRRTSSLPELHDRHPLPPASHRVLNLLSTHRRQGTHSCRLSAPSLTMKWKRSGSEVVGKTPASKTASKSTKKVLGSSTRVKRCTSETAGTDTKILATVEEKHGPKVSSAVPQKLVVDAGTSVHTDAKPHTPAGGSMPSLPSSFSQSFFPNDSAVTFSNVSLDFRGSQLSAMLGSQLSDSAAGYAFFDSQVNISALTSIQQSAVSGMTIDNESELFASSPLTGSVDIKSEDKIGKDEKHSEQRRRLELFLEAKSDSLQDASHELLTGTDVPLVGEGGQVKESMRNTEKHSQPAAEDQTKSDILTNEGGSNHDDSGGADELPPQVDSSILVLPDRYDLRYLALASVRATERVPYCPLSVPTRGVLLNQSMGKDEVDNAFSAGLDASIAKEKELRDVYHELLETMPSEHRKFEKDAAIVEAPWAMGTDKDGLLASHLSRLPHSARVVSEQLLADQREPPWSGQDYKMWMESEGRRQGFHPGMIKTSKATTISVGQDQKARAFASYRQWWKSMISSDDYMRFLCHEETDYLHAIYHLYDSEEEEEDTGPKDLTTPDMRRYRRFGWLRGDVAYEQGTWKAATSDVSGRPADGLDTSNEPPASPLPALKTGAGSKVIGVKGGLQSRFEKVWTMLQVPMSQRIDMMVKYSGAHLNAAVVERAVSMWEKVTSLILQREELLCTMQIRPDLLPNLPGASIGSLKSSSLLQASRSIHKHQQHLRACEKQIRTAVLTIKSDLGDEITFKGVPYLEKMRTDQSERLCWLQHETRQQVLDTVTALPELHHRLTN